MLKRIDGPAASHALAYLATRGATPRVRPLALAELRDRDPRDFVDFLIGLMVPPIKYQIRSSGGPGDPGVMIIDNPSVNIRRLYNPPFRPSNVDFSQFAPN